MFQRPPGLEVQHMHSFFPRGAPYPYNHARTGNWGLVLNPAKIYLTLAGTVNCVRA